MEGVGERGDAVLETRWGRRGWVRACGQGDGRVGGTRVRSWWSAVCRKGFFPEGGFVGRVVCWGVREALVIG